MGKTNRNEISIYKRLMQVNILRATLPLIMLALMIMLVSTVYVLSLMYHRTEDVISSIESSTSIFLRSYLNSLDEIYLSQYKIDHTSSRLGMGLEAFNQSNSEIESIWILDLDGRAIAGTNLNVSEIGRDYSGHDYYINLKNVGDVFWSDVFISQGENRPIVTVAKKYEETIVVLRISLSKLTDMLHIFNISDHSYIAVIDSSGAYIAHSDSEFVTTRAYDPNHLRLIEQERKLTTYEGNSMLAFYRVINDTHWGIIYYQSIQDVLAPAAIMLALGIGFIAGISFMSLSAVFRLNSEIANELEELIGWTKHVARGDYTRVISKRSFDEFNNLSDSYNVMMSEIVKREEELEVSRKELEQVNQNLEKLVELRTKALEKSLDELKSTQAKLIQKEKMASLGSLVTGVAHELNTPIGIAITSITYVEELNGEVLQKLQEGALNKKTFKVFLESIEESTQLILRNLLRASELIKSFKQVSIHQEKISCKEIEIRDIVDATFTSYSIELRKHGVKKSISYSGDLVCMTYPGAISQILSNMIQNSLMHAFKDVEDPMLYLECSSIDARNQISLKYWDNGVGIDAKYVDKIFDPFFTTVMGQGSNGLGMNIVYNLASGLLEGEITYLDEPDKGACFEIRFPKNINC